jgi:hypothetical protein
LILQTAVHFWFYLITEQFLLKPKTKHSFWRIYLTFYKAF